MSPRTWLRRARSGDRTLSPDSDKSVLSPERAEYEQRVVWRIAALLLDYPGQRLLEMRDELRAAAGSVHPPAGPSLVSFIEGLRTTAPIELAAHYVETFDLRRRHCLHLSYYAYGDTRKRGMALLRFKHAYRAAGADLGEHELPDHLPVVLEFASMIDPVAGRRLLVEYLPVMELLRQSLRETGAPHAAVLDAVCATLPELSVADRRRVAELAAQGPPAEEVGLEPFGMDSMPHEQSGGRR